MPEVPEHEMLSLEAFSQAAGETPRAFMLDEAPPESERSRVDAG